MNQDLKNQWNLLDSILLFIETIDTDQKSGLEVRKIIRDYVFNLQPINNDL